MKPNYKNWVPNGMVYGITVGAIISIILFLIFGVSNLFTAEIVKTIFSVIFGIASFIFLVFTALCWLWHFAFSYDGKRQMSRQIIEGIASKVNIIDGGICLDIGCGSGALTNTVAKRNPKAKVVGLDRWGKEYASFNKKLCEDNSLAEGLSNTLFIQGNACKLEFEDEVFDGVTSNYCYHNISGINKQELLLETLRTLKKGGVFAIHDIMSAPRYGDMKAFAEKLKDMGYEEVELIDTTNGMFMTKWESIILNLSGSTILMGKK